MYMKDFIANHRANI